MRSLRSLFERQQTCFFCVFFWHNKLLDHKVKETLLLPKSSSHQRQSAGSVRHTVTDSVPQTCDDDDDDDTVVVCEGRNSQLSGRAWS